MIYLRLTDLLISPPVVHTTTDWQVSTDLQFNTIVTQSLGDSVNKTSMLFNTPLEPGIKYYARGRVLLSTGYTAWSNIDIFTPKDVISGSSSALMPSLVTIPTFTITNNGLNVPVFNTIINVTKVDTLGTATHSATSYVLEDMKGVPVWSSLFNVADMFKKVIPAGIMNINTVYRLRILVHVNSNDTSQLITTTIKTEQRTHGLIMSVVNNAPPGVDLHMDVMPVAGVSGIRAVLYASVNNQLLQVGNYTAVGAAGNIIIVPAASLRPTTKYILRVLTNNPAIWDQRVFNTTV